MSLGWLPATHHVEAAFCGSTRLSMYAHGGRRRDPHRCRPWLWRKQRQATKNAKFSAACGSFPKKRSRRMFFSLSSSTTLSTEITSTSRTCTVVGLQQNKRSHPCAQHANLCQFPLGPDPHCQRRLRCRGQGSNRFQAVRHYFSDLKKWLKCGHRRGIPADQRRLLACSPCVIMTHVDVGCIQSASSTPASNSTTL